jgi:hypothetical protein
MTRILILLGLMRRLKTERRFHSFRWSVVDDDVQFSAASGISTHSW